MKKHSLLALTILTLTFFFHATKNVSAVELVTNGSFETGNFMGWTVVNAGGSYANWSVTLAGQGGETYCGCGITNPAITTPQDGTRNAWNMVTATANQQYTMTQDITIPAAMTATFTWKDRFQMNLTQFCNSAATCGQGLYFVEILNTSNVVLQTLYTVIAPSLTNTNTGWVNHTANLNSYAGQTIRLRFRDFGTATFGGPGQIEIDAVSVNALPIVVAANVSLGGRITAANGQNIRNVAVSLTESNGQTRTTRTNAFGYYNFDEIEVGQNVTLTVNSKRYTFTNPTQIITVAENAGDIDWTAIE